MRALLLLASMLLAAPAQALLFRAYLAPTGNDADPCTLQQPCRLLPAALAAVADGGEIWMLDSANYNTAQVGITKSVTILAVPGALGSVVATGGNAIDIATAGVEVVLRNLVIVPLPSGGGVNGVNMTAGAMLTIEKCLIANMPQAGVRVSTGAIVRIADSTLRDNGVSGIHLQDNARATITRSTVSGNGVYGVLANGTAAGTLTTADIARSTLDGNSNGAYAWSQHATGVVRVSVRDSRAVRNGLGLGAESDAGGAVTLSASSNIVSNNSTDGIGVFSAGARVFATANTVSGNGTGLRNSGGVFESACDNAVRDNTAADSFGAITKIGSCASVAPNFVFVTSTVHTANLGGVAAYDNVCQNRAVSAGLPGTYRAWISDANSSAVSRLGSARGWVRPDGKPFADALAALTSSGQMFYPLRMDETGADTGADVGVFTGTNPNGTVSANTCANWTSAIGPAVLGFTAAGSPLWTGAGGYSCASSQRIYCFGNSRTAVVSVDPVAGRAAFLSSTSITTSAGLAGADAICQSDATAAGLPGTFRALLAASGASAISRFSTVGATWVRRDGVPVVASASQLASGFYAPLHVTAAGVYQGGFQVWVGAASFAAAGTMATTCNNWTSTAGTGNSVRSDQPNSAPSSGQACTLPGRVFCLQQ